MEVVDLDRLSDLNHQPTAVTKSTGSGSTPVKSWFDGEPTRATSADPGAYVGSRGPESVRIAKVV